MTELKRSHVEGLIQMFGGLWRHRDFQRLWAAQSVTQFGTQITFLALPLLAITELNATPFQVGLLAALGALPALFIGPFIGALVDRRARRPLMIASDLGRAALIGLIPLAWCLEFLSIGLVFAVAVASGSLVLVFDVAYRSYLPALVGRAQLVDANSKLELSRSGAEVAGPGVGGLIIQLASAPVALIVDAVTYIVSALFLSDIRAKEARSASERHGSLFRDARDGISEVWANPVLRVLLLSVMTLALFNAFLEAVSLLYIVNELGLGAGLIGLIAGAGGVGFVLGALIAGRVIGRFGTGRSIIAGVLLLAMSDLLLPLAGGSVLTIVILLTLGQVLFGLSLTTFNIGQVSLRQQSAPDRLQGRAHAAFRVAAGVSVPAGALLGGAFGEIVDLRTVLFVAVVGEAAAATWLIASPVRSLRTGVSMDSSD